MFYEMKGFAEKKSSVIFGDFPPKNSMNMFMLTFSIKNLIPMSRIRIKNPYHVQW